jgi:hypothetical protein
MLDSVLRMATGVFVTEADGCYLAVETGRREGTERVVAAEIGEAIAAGTKVKDAYERARKILRG